MYIKLSYNYSLNTPYPAGLWPVEIDHVHDMAKGKISNVFKVKLCNHVGSHIDGPNHFGKNKKPLCEFDISNFIFNNPLVLDILKNDGEIVTAEDLVPHKQAIDKCDLLLIRTGFSKIRYNDTKRYQDKSPGFSISAARFIVEETQLCALGMDTLSFASPQQLDEGIKAHQIMMDQCDRDIFLLEDIDLHPALTHLNSVYVVPLFFEGLDSLPCTILGEVDQ